MREHRRASAWSLAQSGLSAWLVPHLSWGDSYSSLLRPENSTVHKVGTQATAVQAPSAGLRPRWFRSGGFWSPWNQPRAGRNAVGRLMSPWSTQCLKLLFAV